MIMLKLVHPLFMAAFFYFLYCQRNLGLAILGVKEHSPDAGGRPALLEKHRGWAYWLVGMAFLGMIGGLVTTLKVMGLTLPLQQTYGHGFFGILAVAALVAGFWLGTTIKTVVKPKIRERFQMFHGNMVYIIAVFGVLSLLTGAWVLISGPESLPTSLP